MRENRTYGSEGGESGSTGPPYPYHAAEFGYKSQCNQAKHVPPIG